MTKEEAKEILSGYVKACKEDDFLTLEMFEYEKVIEAMAMGAKALSIPSLPSNLDEAADEYASKMKKYQSPSIDIQELECEGILCISTDDPLHKCNSSCKIWHTCLDRNLGQWCHDKELQ